MKDRALVRLLRRLYQTDTPPPDPNLEARLVEQLVAQKHPVAPERPRRLLRQVAVAAGVLLVLGVATRAPAEYAVELGRRVEITLPPHATPPSPKVLEQALGHGIRRQIRLRIRATPEATRIELDVFGDALPSTGELRQRVQAALPRLPVDAISVMPLDGRVRDTVAGALHWEWLRLGSPAALARARAELISRVRQQVGPDAQVEVRVHGRDGRSRVEIRVERRRPSR